ncbi:MAG: hypothetical protein AAF632_20730 [Bacteroidota bacterium]
MARKAKARGGVLNLPPSSDAFKDVENLALLIENVLRNGIKLSIVGSKEDPCPDDRLFELLPGALDILREKNTMMTKNSPSKEHINYITKRSIVKADEFARKMRPIIEEIEHGGADTLTKVAAVLNKREIPTSTGKDWWRPATVWQLKKRIENLDNSLDNSQSR